MGMRDEKGKGIGGKGKASLWPALLPSILLVLFYFPYLPNIAVLVNKLFSTKSCRHFNLQTPDIDSSQGQLVEKISK